MEEMIHDSNLTKQVTITAEFLFKKQVAPVKNDVGQSYCTGRELFLCTRF